MTDWQLKTAAALHREVDTRYQVALRRLNILFWEFHDQIDEAIEKDQEGTTNDAVTPQILTRRNGETVTAIIDDAYMEVTQ